MPKRLKLFCILVVLKGPEWVKTYLSEHLPGTSGLPLKAAVKAGLERERRESGVLPPSPVRAQVGWNVP